MSCAATEGHNNLAIALSNKGYGRIRQDNRYTIDTSVCELRIPTNRYLFLNRWCCIVYRGYHSHEIFTLKRYAHGAAFFQLASAAMHRSLPYLPRQGGCYWLQAINPESEKLARFLCGNHYQLWQEGYAQRGPT